MKLDLSGKRLSVKDSRGSNDKISLLEFNVSTIDSSQNFEHDLGLT
jgi:hypothetical protein